MPLTVVVAGLDGFLPCSVAIASIVSPAFNSRVFTDQLPSPSAIVSFDVPSGRVTVTVASGVAVPVTVVSPSVA